MVAGSPPCTVSSAVVTVQSPSSGPALRASNIADGHFTWVIA